MVVSIFANDDLCDYLCAIQFLRMMTCESDYAQFFRAVVRERKRKLGIFSSTTQCTHVTNPSEAFTAKSESDTWTSRGSKGPPGSHLPHTMDPNSLKTPCSSEIALRAHLAATMRKHTSGGKGDAGCLICVAFAFTDRGILDNGD